MKCVIRASNNEFYTETMENSKWTSVFEQAYIFNSATNAAQVMAINGWSTVNIHALIEPVQPTYKLGKRV